MTPEEAVRWYEAAEREAFAIRSGKRGDDESGPWFAIRRLDGPRDLWFPGTEPTDRRPHLLFASRSVREAMARNFMRMAAQPSDITGFSERTILAYEFGAALLLAID
jgi:hypothetical protein